MYGYVYCITNQINGKRYVGITTKSIERRFKEHCKAESYIGKAIRKHGAENFTLSQIDAADSRDELFLREMRWVRELGTFGSGYNLTVGGEGGRTLPDIEINLNDKQKRFVKFVDRENQKPIDVNDSYQMTHMIIINLVYCYLMSVKKKDKKNGARLLLKLKDEFREVVLKLNLFEPDELTEWASK